MNKTSFEILKTFTRKLANCRYRVAPTTLIEDLKIGGFGYSVEEGVEKVVNNDFVLASDFETLLDSLRIIFREPRLHLKKDNVIKHAESASKYDTSTLKATYRDEKLWRVKDGTPSPEYVHTFVYEDDLAIYENRFICFLIDEILIEVSKKINEVSSKIDTINKKMCGENEADFSIFDYVDFMGDELPILITTDDATDKILRSLIVSKTWLISLTNHPLYKACKKAGNFNPKGLKPTNILTKDVNYYNCYNFYLNYLNKEPVFQTEEGMYLGYVIVNLLGALDSLGFSVTEDTEKVGITNSAAIRFKEIFLTKGVFKVKLTQEDNAILMTVSSPDGNEGKYLFKTLCSSQTAKIEGYTDLTNYVCGIENRADVIKTFIVNDIEQSEEFNAIYVEPTLATSIDVFAKALKSCFLIGYGSSFMYSRYCPVCGSNLVYVNGDDCICNACQTIYHVFDSEEKGIVWIKNVPKTRKVVKESKKTKAKRTRKTK